jgi:hypothetical protein
MSAEGKGTVAISSTRAGAVVSISKSSFSFDVLQDASVNDVRLIGSTAVALDLGDIVAPAKCVLLYNNDATNTLSIKMGGAATISQCCPPACGTLIFPQGAYPITLACVAAGATCAVLTTAVQ